MTLHSSALLLDFSLMLNMMFLITFLHSTRPLAEMGWRRHLAFLSAGAVGGAVLMHFGVLLENGFLIDFRIIPVTFVGLYGGLSWALAVAVPLAAYGYLLLPVDGASVAAVQVVLAAAAAALVHTDSSIFYAPLRQVGWRSLFIAAAANLAFLADPPFFVSRWLPLTLMYAGAITLCALIQAARLHALRSMLETTRLAHTDPLTGLPNLRSFEEAYRFHPEDTPGALLILDVDFFKRINDTYGHLTGDQVLKGVADVIRGQVRQQDVVCRYGGQEFAVLLWQCPLGHAAQVAERIRRAVEEYRPQIPGADELRITISGGLVPLRQGLPMTDRFSAADVLLYRAKSAGRNRIVVEEETAD